MNEAKLYKVIFSSQKRGCDSWAAVVIPTIFAGHFNEGNIIDIGRRMVVDKFPYINDFMFKGLELMTAYNVANVLTEDDL